MIDLDLTDTTLFSQSTSRLLCLSLESHIDNYRASSRLEKWLYDVELVVERFGYLNLERKTQK